MNTKKKAHFNFCFGVTIDSGLWKTFKIMVVTLKITASCYLNGNQVDVIN